MPLKHNQGNLFDAALQISEFYAPIGKGVFTTRKHAGNTFLQEKKYTIYKGSALKNFKEIDSEFSFGIKTIIRVDVDSYETKNTKKPHRQTWLYVSSVVEDCVFFSKEIPKRWDV